MSSFTYLQFAVATLLPVLASAALFLVDRRHALSERHARAWQVVVGLLFGLIAILGTELGIKTDDAVMNVRDAAPITAGLVFGAPAGVIAALIGGIERWFAALWGRGMFTRLACSVSTALAGFYAAALRVKLFGNRRPNWAFGIAIGVVGEVLHLIMIFLTNFEDAQRAFRVALACTFPMITCNALSIGLSIVVVALLGHERIFVKPDKRSINDNIQGSLLVAVVLAAVLTAGLSTLLQRSLAAESTRSLLELNITDVRNDITQASDGNLLTIAHRVAQRIPSQEKATSELLLELKQSLGVSEISFIDGNDTIVASTEEDIVGFDMRSGTQASEFILLLKRNGREYVQRYQPRTEGDNIWRKYAGVIVRDGCVQVGLNAEQFQSSLRTLVNHAAANRHVGESGYLLIVDQKGTIESRSAEVEEIAFDGSQLARDLGKADEGAVFETSLLGTELYGMYGEVEGYRIIALLPKAEANFTRDVTILIGTYAGIIVFAMLFLAIYFLIKRVVVDSIMQTNERLDEITHGNLDVQVDVRNTLEFSELSDDINSTVDTLKTYIDEASARIDQELEYARSIQLSALPSVFPPYPNRADFDIYANMRAAKEVGGDFYDFYLLDESHLAFLVADVSGKGIPAAMFMMQAKTVFKGFADAGMPVEEVLANANEQLCEHNDANMFVTAWMGIIDLETGHVRSANAGHNPPAIMRAADGGFSLLALRRNLVLGCMEGVSYFPDELDLDPGDTLFLYTDGVTEANDANERLYGNDRLLVALDGMVGRSMQELCDGVRDDVDAFVGEADQFDDMTMLALRYNGNPQAGETLTVDARIECIAQVAEFVDQRLVAAGCSPHAKTQIDIAVDEVLANVCSYAYRGADGTVSVHFTLLEDRRQARIVFEDEGVAFNPLLVDEPDTTLGIDQREVGGLGIFIVKKTMDEVSYERRAGCNYLTITKSLDW